MTKDRFIEEIKLLGIDINDDMMDKLDKYYKLLTEWNEKINLTAITNEEDVYLKHFYDSATLCKIIDLKEDLSLCDVGTGAGFPGLVLKILFPNLKIVLVDALEKRIKFLNIMINELGLKDIETVHERSEIFAKNNRERFDIVTARAVANLSTLSEYTVPMVKVGKYFIPMKAIITEELENASHAIKELNLEIEEKLEFNLPIEGSVRNLIKFKKTSKTNAKYPRSFSEMKKRPL